MDIIVFSYRHHFSPKCDENVHLWPEYLVIWSNLNINSSSKTLTVRLNRDSFGVTEHDFTKCSFNKEFHEVSSMDTCDQSGRSHAERAGSQGIHILWQPGQDRRWKEVYTVPGPSE